MEYFEGVLYVEEKPNFWQCGAVINGAYNPDRVPH
jgi:hypothetical protein